MSLSDISVTYSSGHQQTLEEIGSFYRELHDPFLPSWQKRIQMEDTPFEQESRAFAREILRKLLETGVLPKFWENVEYNYESPKKWEEVLDFSYEEREGKELVDTYYMMVTDQKGDLESGVRCFFPHFEEEAHKEGVEILLSEEGKLILSSEKIPHENPIVAQWEDEGEGGHIPFSKTSSY